MLKQLISQTQINAKPSNTVFILFQDTCTLKFNATQSSQYVEDGWYAVALTFEDFPKKTIHVGNEVYNETTPLSQVPLQVKFIEQHLYSKSLQEKKH